jgi:hypothetical protein
MKKRKVGFSIAVVPVWRLVNEWFNGQFFPVDVVNCFIGFVASISVPRRRAAFEVETTCN